MDPDGWERERETSRRGRGAGGYIIIIIGDRNENRKNARANTHAHAHKMMAEDRPLSLSRASKLTYFVSPSCPCAHAPKKKHVKTIKTRTRVRGCCSSVPCSAAVRLSLPSSMPPVRYSDAVICFGSMTVMTSGSGSDGPLRPVESPGSMILTLTPMQPARM